MGNQEAHVRHKYESSGVWEKCGDIVYFGWHQTFGQINIKTRTLIYSEDGTLITSKIRNPKSFNASMNQVIAMVKEYNEKDHYLFEERVLRWFQGKQNVHNHRQAVADNGYYHGRDVAGVFK